MFVLICNIASLVLHLGFWREELIPQCHSRGMRALAGGAAQVESAVPRRRQSTSDEFLSAVQGG